MSPHPEDSLLSGVVIALIVVIVAIPVIMMVLIVSGSLGSYGFHMMENFGGSWWIIMLPIFGLLAIALIMLLILGRPREGPLPPVPYPPFPAEDKDKGPLDILNRRLASGEISLDEYLRLREHITKK